MRKLLPDPSARTLYMRKWRASRREADQARGFYGSCPHEGEE